MGSRQDITVRNGRQTGKEGGEVRSEKCEWLVGRGRVVEGARRVGWSEYGALRGRGLYGGGVVGALRAQGVL